MDENDTDEFLKAAIQATLTWGITRLLLPGFVPYFTFDFEGDQAVLTDELRKQIENEVGPLQMLKGHKIDILVADFGNALKYAEKHPAVKAALIKSAGEALNLVRIIATSPKDKLMDKETRLLNVMAYPE